MTTEVSVATMDFFTAEVDAVHAACDSARVPRGNDEGFPLTIAQRVETLALAYERVLQYRKASLRA